MAETTTPFIRYLFRLKPEPGKGMIPTVGLFWKRRVTANGRVLLPVLTLVGTLASVLSVNVPLYYFACFLFSLFLVARLIGLLFRPKVEVERLLPERCAVGAPIRVSARVHNTSDLPVFDLAVSERHPPDTMELAEVPEYIDCIDGGEEATLHYALTPTRRGMVDLKGPLALSAYPFGLFHAIRNVDAPHRMLVYPRFAPLDRINLPVGRKHQPGGLQLVSFVGDSPEFIGNRDYLPGDRLRDIHHAAWARTGYPVVREYQQEYLCRVALVVDTFLGEALRGRMESALAEALDLRSMRFDKKSQERHDDLEAGISLAAAVADVLSRQEYVIDIFAAGPELYHFQAGRSLAYLDNILDVLACIEACPRNPFTSLGPAIMEEISQISTMVVILLDWDEAREEFVRSIRECGVAVKVIVVKQSPTTERTSGFSTEAGPIIRLKPKEVEKGVGQL
ncbi:MAG: DUF58 domain-containing protein [Planctomycetota bacterium]|jgi:uncharacterized protein (DUF58 family)